MRKMNNGKHPDGVVTISDRAVKQIASYAARRCNDVAEMSDKSRAGETAKFVSGNADNSGVYVKNTKSGIELELYAACVHGADVKALSDEICIRVKDGFCNTGINVAKISVHINDVR